MTTQPVPTYPCPDCPAIRTELCWTCPLPFEHIQVKPRCEFCGAPAVRGIALQFTSEGDYGITYTGFMTIPVCDRLDCQEEAEHVRAMTR
jgi:hypothetical protein